MLSKPKAPDAIDPNYGRPGRSPTGPLPGTLIGMSLRQDIPGELLSSRARFRFSCHDHSETDDTGCQQKSSEQRSVPTSRVSKVDTSHPFSESAPGEGDLREANVAFQKCTFLERYDRHV